MNFNETKSTITATGTRNQVKQRGVNLLPHTITTNSKDPIPDTQLDPNRSTTHFNNERTPESPLQTSNVELSPEYPPQTTHTNNQIINPMADSVLVARARKARYDDLPSFSGYPSEDAERFLKSIKNIAKANDDSTDKSFLEIVRGKLTQSAGSWFDDNESLFMKWLDFETAFRNRYFSTTMVSAKFEKLSQRIQRYDESVTAYFDEVITLCKEIDPKMPDKIIIQHLMKGINPEFRKELTRRQSTISTLSEFLKLAKLEQDLHDAFTQSQPINVQPEPILTYHLSSNERKKPNDYSSKYECESQPQSKHRLYTSSNKSFGQNQNSYPTIRRTNMATYEQNYQKKSNTPSRNWQTRNPLNKCKVCGKQNHRSIDCKHKCSSGCYNCGQRHSVRDCPNPPHFQ